MDVFLADPEVYDGCSQQHPKTLQQIPDNVNKSCPNTGIVSMMEVRVKVVMMKVMMKVTLFVSLQSGGGKAVVVTV
ncbi:hypothetical protein CgunFtcFv8_012353 [Champsocephalus gunnari]|uniref:Uncharacterized protein n=1 Tax=Champsocephalus gunnari TaxID=52237 RepID=A0AAN8D8P8_CHAGU|nr:hypothetical protein CgunFtcFv8_012353 [Champsocephalus gunnari]